MRKWFLLLLPVFIFAQDFYEASGQTQAFTLAAGNKAEWNSGGVSTEQKAVALPGNVTMALLPNPVTGSLRISVSGITGLSTVTIYDIAGKKVQIITVNNKLGSAVLNTLSNGIYFARLHVDGRAIQTTKFLVAR